MAQPRTLRVGLVGAGLGGLAAAIAIARAGVESVTILEAAAELGEIGAGIQMTPNVSRLLIKWGVADIIGDDLVQCKEINTRDKAGKIIRRTDLKKVVREFGFPWWVVSRHHLHFGLAEAARRHGVKIELDARVSKLDYQDESQPVKVTTYKGQEFEFDFAIGCDGIKSVVRQTLFPDVVPRAPINNAAYRAIMPYEKVYREVPEAREFGNSIDLWGMEKGYIIMYPISGGRDWNAVFSHFRDKPVTTVEDVDMQEFRDYWKGIDPRIKKIIDIVPESKRWPLLATGPLNSWSSPQKNVVLMGDAAHSFYNHLAQGASASMEDGAFLGRVLAEVVRGVVTLREAIHLYEKTRMPRVWIKQQASFIEGLVYMADETRAKARDASSVASVAKTAAEEEVANLQEKPRVTGPDANARSWDLWGAPETIQSIFGYDAEGDADHAILTYLTETTPWDKETGVSEGLEKKWTGWYLPEDQVGRIAKSRGSNV